MIIFLFLKSKYIYKFTCAYVHILVKVSRSYCIQSHHSNRANSCGTPRICRSEKQLLKHAPLHTAHLILANNPDYTSRTHDFFPFLFYFYLLFIYIFIFIYININYHFLFFILCCFIFRLSNAFCQLKHIDK